MLCRRLHPQETKSLRFAVVRRILLSSSIFALDPYMDLVEESLTGAGAGDFGRDRGVLDAWSVYLGVAVGKAELGRRGHHVVIAGSRARGRRRRRRHVLIAGGAHLLFLHQQRPEVVQDRLVIIVRAGIATDEWSQRSRQRRR